MSTEYSSSTDFLQQLATAAANNADFYAQYTRNFMGTPGTDRPNLREPTIRHSATRPDLGPAPKLSDVLEAGDGGSELLRLLDAETEKWMTKYFPAMDQCLQSMPEDFLCGVLSGVRPFGLDKTVFDIAWERARDRGHKTSESERAQIASVFSRNGFTLPVGAQVAAEIAAVQRASDAAAEVSREQAVQDATIRFEMLKFVQQAALDYKRGILSALADFQRQWAVLPNQALERSRIRAQAQATLTSALSSYWNVQMAFEELLLKANSTGAEVDLAVSRNRISNAAQDGAATKAASIASIVRAFADQSSQVAQAAGSLVAQIESV